MILRAAAEGVILLIVAVSPWLDAAQGAAARLFLAVSLAFLLALWAARLVLDRTVSMRGNAPLICLAGFVLLSAVQIVPLPKLVRALISPGTAGLYDFYLPAEREQLPGEPAATDSGWHPLSLGPGDTWEFLLNSLALCAFYAAVLNSAASADAFRRFAWVAALNGVLVCLLAFARRVAMPRAVLWWEGLQATAPDYGPFDSRNTFPFYVNVCVGLALGLLAARARKTRGMIFGDVVLVWLFVSIGVMMTAVTLSLSRGGLLSLLMAIAIGAVFWIRSGKNRTAFAVVIWLAPFMLLAVGWAGYTALEHRFERLVENHLDLQARYGVWRDSLRLVPRSPAFGTGDGTFRVVEPIARTTEGMDEWAYDNAHNEYVEALVEGGVVRLCLTLALLTVVTVQGVRNFRDYMDRTLGWLVLGGLVGIWAVALHSFVDFGIHYPAIALVAAAVAALVTRARQRDEPGDRRVLSFPAALLLALALVAAGGVFAWNGLQQYREQRYREAARRDAALTAESAARRVAWLQAAVRCRPRSYEAHFELSIAQYQLAGFVGDKHEAAALYRDSLAEARAARDLSPAFAKAQVRMALLRDHFENAPPALWYLERARRSASTDPALWYASGQLRLDHGDVEGAWADWRRSLAIRDTYFNLIFFEAIARLSPAELLEKVLPDRPEVIYRVANRLARESPISQEALAPYFQRAVTLLERRVDPTAAQEAMRAEMLQKLNRREEAVDAYRRAVGKEPSSIPYRLALARGLEDVGFEKDDSLMLHEARREAGAVLLRDFDNREAKDLIQVIERELILLE